MSLSSPLRPPGPPVSRRVAIVAMAGVLEAGCGSGPKPLPPTQINGSLQASTGLNPNKDGRSSPLLLRLYELKSSTAFDSADFISLFDRDQATLGADLVAREEIVLQPGETRAYNKTLAAEVRFIAVVGAYRDLEHSRWRSVAAVTPNKTQKLLVKVEALAVGATITP